MLAEVISELLNHCQHSLPRDFGSLTVLIRLEPKRNNF
jgi:hypothetical protein